MKANYISTLANAQQATQVSELQYLYPTIAKNGRVIFDLRDKKYQEEHISSIIDRIYPSKYHVNCLRFPFRAEYPTGDSVILWQRKGYTEIEYVSEDGYLVAIKVSAGYHAEAPLSIFDSIQYPDYASGVTALINLEPKNSFLFHAYAFSGRNLK